jgi:AraC-like DNA-binding protein
MQEELGRALPESAPSEGLTPGSVWPDTSRLEKALEALDLSAFDREAHSLADQAALQGRVDSALVLFDQLRNLAERLSIDAGADDQQRRMSWIRSLTEAPGAREAAAFFLSEVESMIAPFQSAHRSINPIVLRARRFIDDHAAEPISLSRVAGELGVARNYLSALFKRENGLTLTEYIHRVRIRRAEVLLHAGDKTLAEAAYQVGYQSYRHFYRNFVRICGQSPTAYVRDLSRKTGPRRLPEGGPDAGTEGLSPRSEG